MTSLSASNDRAADPADPVARRADSPVAPGADLAPGGGPTGTRPPASGPPALTVEQVTHRYGDRVALDGVSLDVTTGERFAILGPNGGGKSTLFRLITTLAPLQRGRITIAGHDVTVAGDAVRRHLGVVFQAASLDDRLTVAENLRLHASVYGVSRAETATQIDGLSRRLGFADRLTDRVGTLSGGLKRRVELARGLFHRPAVLILDEPTTGLDIGARREFWQLLEQIRSESGMTVIYTTHLLDEAEKADRLVILDAGRIVAIGRPEDLVREVGGDTVTIEAVDPAGLVAGLAASLGITAGIMGEELRFETDDAAHLVPKLLTTFPEQITSVRVGRPSLEDVFIRRTGRTFTEADDRTNDVKPKRKH